MSGGRTVGVPRIRQHSFLHILWAQGVLGAFLDRALRSDESFHLRWVAPDPA